MSRELSIGVRDAAGQERTVAVVVEAGATPGRARVTVGGVVHDVDAVLVRPGTWSVLIAGRAHLVDLEPRGRGQVDGRAGLAEAALLVEDARQARLRATAARAGATASGERIKAPIAGKIVKVLVVVGDIVAAGQPVVVVEAMKMENEIVAVRGGTVTRLGKGAGAAIDTGELLVELA